MTNDVHAPAPRTRFPCQLSALLACTLLAITGGCASTGQSSGGPPTQSATRPASGPVVVDVDTASGIPARPAPLAAGAPPAVPWTSGSILHTPQHEVTSPAIAHQVGWLGRLAPYGGGFVTSGGTGVRFFDARGRLVRSVAGEGPSVSPDGARVAWWDYRTRRAVIASTAGQVLKRITPPSTWAPDAARPRERGVSIVGWVGRDELLLAMRSSGSQTGAASTYWRTSGESIPHWSFWSSALATVPMGDPDRTVVLGRVTYDTPEPDCLAAYRIDSPRVLWRHCYRRGGESFGDEVGRASPDGSHVLVSGLNQTSGTRSFTLVLDPVTGLPVVRFDNGRYIDDRVGASSGVWGNGQIDAAFEGNDHVLLAVYQQHRPMNRPHPGNYTGAIMRCDLRLRCENATVPKHWTQWWEGPPQVRAYSLP